MKPFGTGRFGGYLYAADLVAVAALLAWGVALARGRVTLRGGGFYTPAALYLGAVFISMVNSTDLRRSLTTFPIELYVVALGLLSYEVVRSAEDLCSVLRAWMVGAGITAFANVLGVVLFYAGIRDGRNFALAVWGSLPQGNYPRVAGLFLNMNMACNYLSVSLLMLLALRRLDWIGPRAFRSLGLFVVTASVFTVSPGLGGILLGAGIWLWALWRRSRPSLALLSLAGGCAAALAFVVATMISPVNSGGPGTVFPLLGRRVEASSRLLCWGAAWNAALARPLSGQGVGVPVECPAWTTPSGEVQHLSDAHNTYLSIASHDGVLGVLALAALIAFFLRRSFPLTLDGGELPVLRTALAIAFIQAFLYQGLAGSWEHSRHLWILLGLLAAVDGLLRSTRKEAPPLFPRTPREVRARPAPRYPCASSSGSGPSDFLLRSRVSVVLRSRRT